MSGWLDRPRGAYTYGEWAGVLAFLAVGAFAVVLAGTDPARLPQLVRGDDVMAVAFGGARETISLAMVHKADSYFHGGIDMECDELHEHECEHDHDHCHGHAEESCSDPWQWIDSHVRAPEVHRHLEGGEAAEMMPWFWAAVRSDPHNAEAWSVAWYTASHMMKDPVLAARILAEAKAKNPDSIEIAFTEGRSLYDGGRGDIAAAKAAFERTRKLGDAKCGGDVKKLSPREEEAYRFAGNYLLDLEKKDVK